MRRLCSLLLGLLISAFLSLNAASLSAKEATPSETVDVESMPIAGGNGWLMPKDVSEHGWRIDNLILVTMVFVVILFVIMCYLMFWACYKHGKDHKAHYDHGDAKRQVLFAAFVSSVIFFVVDGNLFANSTWDTYTVFWNFAKAEGHPKAVLVEVNARQWAWDIRYAGPDGVFNSSDDIVTLNDMRIPVEVPISVQISAVDVIHSFYLPHLRAKMDAVPGNINRFWFTAKETGRYEIACAQHCGLAHYKMKGLLTVLSQEDYAEWAARASANSAHRYDPDDIGAHWGWPWTQGEK